MRSDSISTAVSDRQLMVVMSLRNHTRRQRATTNSRGWWDGDRSFSSSENWNVNRLHNASFPSFFGIKKEMHISKHDVKMTSQGNMLVTGLWNGSKMSQVQKCFAMKCGPYPERFNHLNRCRPPWWGKLLDFFSSDVGSSSKTQQCQEVGVSVKLVQSWKPNPKAGFIHQHFRPSNLTWRDNFFFNVKFKSFNRVQHVRIIKIKSVLQKALQRWRQLPPHYILLKLLCFV